MHVGLYVYVLCMYVCEPDVPVCIEAYVELCMHGCLYVACTVHWHCHDAKFERGGNSVHFLS
jgi:hypothetical protein